MVGPAGTNVGVQLDGSQIGGTKVLGENAVGPARRGRLARARAAVKHHPDYSEAAYLRAVEAAFENWEAMQNAGR